MPWVRSEVKSRLQDDLPPVVYWTWDESATRITISQKRSGGFKMNILKKENEVWHRNQTYRISKQLALQMIGNLE